MTESNDFSEVPSILIPEVALALRKKFNQPYKREQDADFRAGMPILDPRFSERILEQFGFTHEPKYLHTIATVTPEPVPTPFLQSLRETEEIFRSMKLTTSLKANLWERYQDLVNAIYSTDRNIPPALQTQTAQSANCFMIGSALIIRCVELNGYIHHIDNLVKSQELFPVISDLKNQFKDRSKLTNRISSEFHIPVTQKALYQILRSAEPHVPDIFALNDGGIAMYSILDKNWGILNEILHPKDESNRKTD